MSNKNLALIAATFVAVIYGMSYTIAKDVMPLYIDAYGFILLRVGGAVILFWAISLAANLCQFVKKESIEKQDYPRIFWCAFYGVALNMLTFFKGLSLTTPISAAVIMVSTPIIVLVFSAIITKEKLKTKKIVGVFIGLFGTAFLILYGKSFGTASNANLGNFLVLINAISYAFYLIIVKKLMDKYNTFTFVKWIYLIGFFMVLPFGYAEFVVVSWAKLPINILWEMGFIVVFTTFFTYLLNLLSMRELKPTSVAAFIYLQPLFASIIAIGLGKDSLSWVKIVAAACIFLGVYLVSWSSKKSD